MTDPTRADIEAYICSVTGKEPTEVAVRSIERMLRGELPVEIGGITGATGTRNLASRLIVSDILKTLGDGKSGSLKTFCGLVARWTTSGLPDVCQRCLAMSELDLGFGPGLFPPQLWPRAVHPDCGCYQSDLREMTREEEEIGQRLVAEGVTVYGRLGWDEQGGEPKQPSRSQWPDDGGAHR